MTTKRHLTPLEPTIILSEKPGSAPRANLSAACGGKIRWMKPPNQGIAIKIHAHMLPVCAQTFDTIHDPDVWLNRLHPFDHKT